MDPKTLRIGNTIRKTQSEIWHKKHRGALTTVTSWELQVLEKNANEGYYEGVELTPELLLEYGWHYEGCPYNTYRHPCYWDSLYNGGSGLMWEHDTRLIGQPLNYLHELQNAFLFMVGKELEKAPAPDSNYTQPSLF